MAGRPKSSLTADLRRFVEKTDARLLAVARQSIKEVVELAQKPVAKGGRMRVDTGFLRRSGVSQIGKMPSGPSERPKDAEPNSFNWDGKGLTETLSKMKRGDRFFFGWTAKYAQVREKYDGFMEAALMRWKIIVRNNAEKLRSNVRSKK